MVFLERLRDFPILVDLSRRSHEKLRRVSQLFDEAIELLGARQIVTLMAEGSHEIIGRSVRKEPSGAVFVLLRLASVGRCSQQVRKN